MLFKKKKKNILARGGKSSSLPEHAKPGTPRAAFSRRSSRPRPRGGAHGRLSAGAAALAGGVCAAVRAALGSV